ncbi:MAG: UDP-N-acetylmuramoyl-L-alanyl-D-glutamate--2,6-diaminopimelate ligase [Acetivibrionales bacterium]|jgi:UDP-N-acetylmuramoyl-L-alanyl-D-glutamate--2,6-diaminopimelate ligase
MILKELVKGLNIIYSKGDLDIEISDIAYDSRKVKKGYLFVCIDGTKVDGHKYIPGAIENGAVALLVEKDVEVPDGITVIRIDNTRYGLAHVSDTFFKHPSEKFCLIGITGTKGKTTTTYMIKSILECAKQKVGLIGTISNMIGSEALYTERTTPESYDLQSLFSEMVDKKVDSVVMEVSSQGLQLHRVSCSQYEIGVFTNISRAHIGPREHKNFDEYLEAKIKLFKACKKGLVNVDCLYGKEVIENAKCDILTYGIDNEADIRAVNIEKHPSSVRFKAVTPWGNEEIWVNIPGKFSVYNALASIGVCALRGIPFDCIRTGLKNVSVRGRVEVIETGKDYTVMIDYAHSPDSLENILTTVKEFAPSRVVCLFGCGGDRDKTMRPMMGEISGRISDFTIITSDNPRTEDPVEIINGIEEGIKKTNGKYIKIVDRREAIKYSLMNAKPGDIIILAGKGHENYITFKDKTIHFDEREVVKEILKEMENLE